MSISNRPICDLTSSSIPLHKHSAATSSTQTSFCISFFDHAFSTSAYFFADADEHARFVAIQKQLYQTLWIFAANLHLLRFSLLLK